MHLTEVRINLCAPTGHSSAAPRGGSGNRLKAFCSLTFDDAFVVRDVKLIEGNDGLFLAMPSRKLTDHCPVCREKNHLRAKFCCNCGSRLEEDRHLRYRNAGSRLKLHADVAHPINGQFRQEIEREVLRAYSREVDRSRQPGYVPPSLDGEDFDFYDDHTPRPVEGAFRVVGTTYPPRVAQPAVPLRS